MSVLDKSVTQNENGWDFECPNIQGSPCGEPGGRGFLSTGWPTKKAALARGQEHFDEHKGLGAAQELHEFRVSQGIGVADDGSTVELKAI